MTSPESDRVQVGARVRPSTWQRFREYVNEKHGKTHGVLGEEVDAALLAYVADDRLSRLEDQVDEVRTLLSDEVLAILSEIDSTHTHADNDVVAEVNRIADKLQSLDRTVIKTEHVEREIERRRGGDDRTLDKWKAKLKRWGAAYKHPSDEVWTLDRDQWVKWSTEYINNNPTVTRGDVIEDYPIEWDEFEQLATEAVA